MIYAIAAAVVLVLDQAVKFWTTKTIPLNAMGDACVQLIPKVLHVTNIHNTGAAFSILRDSRWLLVVVSAVFIALILILISQEIIHTKFGKWTSVLVAAGAAGNCIDRIIYGYVVDMLELELFTFPVFNVADIFISVCGILFCVHVILYRDPGPAAEASAKRRDRGLPVEEESQPSPKKRSRRNAAASTEDQAEEAPSRHSQRAKSKQRDEYYASSVPHRDRSTHRTLEEEMRPADPTDPFKEWSAADQEDASWPEDGETPRHRRRPDPFLEDENAYIEEDLPAPRRKRRATSEESEPASHSRARSNEVFVEEEPIRRREQKVAPTLAAEDYDVPIDTQVKRHEEPAEDSGEEEFSLEDILNEFGNFSDDI